MYIYKNRNNSLHCYAFIVPMHIAHYMIMNYKVVLLTPSQIKVHHVGDIQSKS